MTKVIVTTTINQPTQAIELYDVLPGWTLVVVGDKKTPKDYKLRKGIYIGPSEQEKYCRKLSDLIGWNTIQRRNFGFLWARDLKADIIATVDDDNIPNSNWGTNLLLGKPIEVSVLEGDTEAFDPLSATNHPELWHRGFPVQLIHSKGKLRAAKERGEFQIQADLWNGDPDVDAIARIAMAPSCEITSQYFPFCSRQLAPFNSQNTFLTRDVLPHYFVLPHVGRMDDIWASYHVQSLGFRVVYGKTSVRQVRNEHDLVKDLRDEQMGYESTIKIVRAINARKYSPVDFWPTETIEAFQTYQSLFPEIEANSESGIATMRAP